MGNIKRIKNKGKDDDILCYALWLPDALFLSSNIFVADKEAVNSLKSCLIKETLN